MPLSATALRNVRPTEKPYKLFDEKGLYLLVPPTSARGAGLWRFKYRIHGVEKLLALGQHPEISLKRARVRRDAARELLGDGIDPSAHRQAAKAAQSDTFEAIAREALALKRQSLEPMTYERRLARFEKQLFPYLGRKPIATITAADVLPVLKRIEAKGNRDTAHRCRAEAGAVFRYAVATGRAERDPTADLRGALASPVVRNFAAITDPQKIGELLRAIDGYNGQPATAYALKLAPLLFVRPGELRRARWEEFDLQAGVWRIPAERMKMREAHVVPLAPQAVALLEELAPITGPDGLLFPGLRDASRPISDVTVNAALRRLGYTSEQMTGHGFRSMASTCLNEQGFAPDVIELQLAHAERNEVRAAYNRSTRLPERRRMMTAWANYLDGLKAGGKVIAIRRARA